MEKDRNTEFDNRPASVYTESEIDTFMCMCLWLL